MEELLTWSLLVPVAGYWFLMLSRFRFMVGLQSGYHLFFLSLLAGVISMSLTAVGVDVLQGSEPSFPDSTRAFFFIWAIDIALITLIFGTAYLVENKVMSKAEMTKTELRIANKLGEKIICFLGEAMINEDLVQLSIGNGRTCVGGVTKVPTPLPVWGVPSTKKEVSILLVRNEFLDPVTGKVTKKDVYQGRFLKKEDRIELHIPLSQIEFAGLYGRDDDTRRLEDG